MIHRARRNFLKLRAGERNQKRQDIQEKGDKNAKYMGFNREISRSPISLVGPIAGPSSPRKKIGKLTSGSLVRYFVHPYLIITLTNRS